LRRNSGSAPIAWASLDHRVGAA